MKKVNINGVRYELIEDTREYFDPCGLCDYAPYCDDSSTSTPCNSSFSSIPFYLKTVETF